MKWGENSTNEMGSLILNVVPHVASDLLTLQTAIGLYSIAAAPKVGDKPLFIGSGVVDAAGAQAGAVTPGKVVALYGARVGPGTLATAQVKNGKLATSLGGTQVLFDGIPAPLLYTSSGQLGAIVPYAVDGKLGTQVQVLNGSSLSDKVALPVAQVAPSLFSMDYSGVGQGAILNQDLSVNSSANPAAAGSIVVLYATGEGQTIPAGVDGLLAHGPVYPKPGAAGTVTPSPL